MSLLLQHLYTNVRYQRQVILQKELTDYQVMRHSTAMKLFPLALLTK